MIARKALIPIILAVIGVFLIVRQFNDPGIQPINVWQITDLVSSDARIAWQLSVPCMTPGYTTPHGAIAVKEGRLLFHNVCRGFDAAYVALDVSSGELAWTYALHGSFQIVPARDGFLTVYGDSYVNYLSPDGKEIWRSEKFFSRAMRAIFPENDVIYAPYETQSEKLIYILSLDSGEIIDSITEKDVIAEFEDIRIIAAEDSPTAQVINKQDASIVWTLENPSSIQVPFTQFLEYNDILIVSYEYGTIKAFKVFTGEEVWSIDHDFASAPLILNDLLLIYSSHDLLRMVDIQTGTVVGSIQFRRSSGTANNHNIALAAEGNFLAIAFRATQEIIGVSLSTDK